LNRLLSPPLLIRRHLLPQLRPHTALAPRVTPGVTKLVVAINKMDDHSVVDPSGKWSKER